MNTVVRFNDAVATAATTVTLDRMLRPWRIDYGGSNPQSGGGGGGNLIEACSSLTQRFSRLSLRSLRPASNPLGLQDPTKCNEGGFQPSRGRCVVWKWMKTIVSAWFSRVGVTQGWFRVEIRCRCRFLALRIVPVLVQLSLVQFPEGSSQLYNMCPPSYTCMS